MSLEKIKSKNNLFHFFKKKFFYLKKLKTRKTKSKFFKQLLAELNFLFRSEASERTHTTN